MCSLRVLACPLLLPILLAYDAYASMRTIAVDVLTVEPEASFSPTVLRSHDRVTLISDPMSGSRSIATRRPDYITWSVRLMKMVRAP